MIREPGAKGPEQGEGRREKILFRASGGQPRAHDGESTIAKDGDRDKFGEILALSFWPLKRRDGDRNCQCYRTVCQRCILRQKSAVPGV